MKKLITFLNPFVVALIATVLLASVLPARGGFAVIADKAVHGGIALLFFLHGAKLSPQALLTGVGNLRLHAAVLATTYILFPAIGFSVSHLSSLAPSMMAGLLFLSLLPSTVQSSIALTALAEGNVAAAVCSASLSNLAGTILTPLLVTAMMGGMVNISWASAQAIVVQLLVPFTLGQTMRPLIGGFVERHRRLLGRVDQGSILLVVYTAFGSAVVGGLWQRTSPASLSVLLLCCAMMLALVLAGTWLAGRALRLERADAVVLLFCGSKKSLASGVPMAGLLFAPEQVGMIILPLMLFHQLQLIVCTIIAPQLRPPSLTSSQTPLLSA